MKAAKTQKHFKEIPYPPKKKFLKRKLNVTRAKTNAPILQISSENLKLTIQIYKMRNNKNLVFTK